MKARMIGGVKYKSRSAYVKELLELSSYTGMTDSEIAREAKVRPQTVNRIKNTMLGLYRRA